MSGMISNRDQVNFSPDEILTQLGWYDHDKLFCSLSLTDGQTAMIQAAWDLHEDWSLEEVLAEACELMVANDQEVYVHIKREVQREVQRETNDEEVYYKRLPKEVR